MEEGLREAVLDGLRAQALYAVDASRVWEERRRRKQYDVKGDADGTVKAGRIPHSH